MDLTVPFMGIIVAGVAALLGYRTGWHRARGELHELTAGRRAGGSPTAVRALLALSHAVPWTVTYEGTAYEDVARLAGTDDEPSVDACAASVALTALLTAAGWEHGVDMRDHPTHVEIADAVYRAWPWVTVTIESEADDVIEAVITLRNHRGEVIAIHAHVAEARLVHEQCGAALLLTSDNPYAPVHLPLEGTRP